MAAVIKRVAAVLTNKGMVRKAWHPLFALSLRYMCQRFYRRVTDEKIRCDGIGRAVD